METIMPIRMTDKRKKGDMLIVEGNAQLLDETKSIDEPVILQQCKWKAMIEPGQKLWSIEILSGDDMRGYIQQELQKRTKRKE
jgi:hypothetical protein